MCRLEMAGTYRRLHAHAIQDHSSQSMSYSSVLSSFREARTQQWPTWSNAKRTAVGQHRGFSEDHNLHPNHRTDHLNQNQARTRELISAQMTSHKHSKKALSCLRQLSPGVRENTRYINSTRSVSKIIIIYIYHALINALSAYMIHINLNMIFYTHVQHSPTKTIYIK